MRPYFPVHSVSLIATIKWLVILSCVLHLSACGSDNEDAAVSGEQLVEARRLFTYWCSGCHGVDATGNGSRPNIVGKTGQQILHAFNTVSDMSSLSAVVTADEVKQIAAYLYYLESVNQAVKPPMTTIEVVDAKYQ